MKKLEGVNGEEGLALQIGRGGGKLFDRREGVHLGLELGLAEEI